MTRFIAALTSLTLLIPLVRAASSKTCSLVDIQRNGTLIQECDVLCKPAAWTDLLIFYIGNYFAHVATIRTEPGQAWQDSMIYAINALFFPSTGLLAAVKAIATGAVFARTSLETAAKAGALYMVVKMPESERDRRERILFPDDATAGDGARAVATDSRIDEDRPELTLDDVSSPINASVTENAKHETAVVPGKEADRAPRPGSSGEVSPTHEKGQHDPEKSPRGSDGRVAKRHHRARYDVERADGMDDIALPQNTIHGRLMLPKGYTIERVPAYSSFEGEGDVPLTLRSFVAALFKKPKDQPEHMTELAQDYSFLKAAVALGQALYAISTLYKTRGAQIQQFGYVAYGFTVLPYAFMSTINLISNLVCPEYSAIFLIKNEELRQLRQHLEAENRTSELVFEGCVGGLSAATEEKLKLTKGEIPKIGPVSTIVLQVATIVTGLAIYLAVVGGLTGFAKGHSTHAQRAWIMTWYCFGVVMGPYIKVFLDGVIVPMNIYAEGRKISIFSFIMTILIYATPAIGGMVVVGQEINQYGVCEAI